LFLSEYDSSLELDSSFLSSKAAIARIDEVHIELGEFYGL